MTCDLENCDGNLGMRLVRPETEEYGDEAVESIKAGNVIDVPVYTLYRFACDACNSLEAVNRIYKIKGQLIGFTRLKGVNTQVLLQYVLEMLKT